MIWGWNIDLCDSTANHETPSRLGKSHRHTKHSGRTWVTSSSFCPIWNMPSCFDGSPSLNLQVWLSFCSFLWRGNLIWYVVGMFVTQRNIWQDFMLASGPCREVALVCWAEAWFYWQFCSREASGIHRCFIKVRADWTVIFGYRVIILLPWYLVVQVYPSAY